MYSIYIIIHVYITYRLTWLWFCFFLVYKACNFTTKKFEKFVRGVTFSPRSGISIEVGTSSSTQDSFDTFGSSRCQNCISVWEESGLERVIRDTQWNTISSREDVRTLVRFWLGCKTCILQILKVWFVSIWRTADSDCWGQQFVVHCYMGLLME